MDIHSAAALAIPTPRIRSTCDACLDAKVRCSRDRPSCRRCQQHGRECVYSLKRRLGRPKGTGTKHNAPSKPSSGTDSATSTPQQEVPGQFPGGLPSPSWDRETGEMSMDALLFDQSMPFVGNAEGCGPGFPMWSPQIENELSESLKNTAWNIPTPSSVPDLQQRPFPSSWSDAASTMSPTKVDANPNGNIFHEYASSLGTPSTMIQSPKQRKDPRDGSYFMFPASLPNVLPNNFGNAANARPSTTSSSLNSAPSGPRASIQSCPPSTPLMPPRCSCYGIILQRLAELKDEKATFLSSRVDNIMRLQKDIRLQTLALLKCESCVSERSRSLLLIGVLLESIIDLLEGVPFNDPRMVAADARMQHSLPRRQSMPAHMHTNSDTGRLVLGEYEISGEEKLGFLRHLVNSRLNELSALTRQLHDHVQVSGAHDPSFRAVATVMAGCSQRIHAIMSRLQN